MKQDILVIDDERAVRNSFKLSFEDGPYKLYMAEDGATGLEILDKMSFALVFLDLKMPDMNGVQVLKKIREKDKNTLVYIITAFHEEFISELNEARNMGYDFELLSKPIDSEQLNFIVDSLLKNNT